MKVVVPGGCDHNWPQVEIAVGDVDGQNARWPAKMPDVEGKSFARQQMDRDRVTAKRIKNQDVELV
jgi:hypothetical protein